MIMEETLYTQESLLYTITGFSLLFFCELEKNDCLKKYIIYGFGKSSKEFN